MPEPEDKPGKKVTTLGFRADAEDVKLFDNIKQSIKEDLIKKGYEDVAEKVDSTFVFQRLLRDGKEKYVKRS